MVSLQNIYNKSPIALQNIMVTASGILKARNRYGKIYAKRRRWLLEYDEWSLDAKLNHQSETMRNFIIFANDKSLFYQQIYADIDIGLIQQPEHLNVLPIVDKEMLRSNIHDVHTVREKKSTQGETGGTTGKPLAVRYTFADSMRRMALLDHFKSRHGFENRAMLKATFSGKPLVPPGQTKNIYWRYNRAANQLLYSTFHLNEKNLAYYVRHLNEVKPKALDGFVTSLTDIASFIERNNIKLSFRPVAIFPTAETVTSSKRRLLERVFKCEVYDQYASSEGAPFLTECAHNSLHMEFGLLWRFRTVGPLKLEVLLKERPAVCLHQDHVVPIPKTSKTNCAVKSSALPNPSWMLPNPTGWGPSPCAVG